MAWKAKISAPAVALVGKDMFKEIIDAYKDSDNMKDFMLSDTMKGLYERAGVTLDKALLKLQDSKAFDKFLDVISKTDTGAALSEALKERLEKIGEEPEKNSDTYNFDFNDPKTMDMVVNYLNAGVKDPNGMEGQAYKALCDELKLTDPEIQPALSDSQMHKIVSEHVEFACNSSHDEVMKSYAAAFADLGYGDNDNHPSMATHGDMLVTAQNYILLCEDYGRENVIKAYDSAISDLGFGDPDNHPNIEQTPGMMRVVQNHIELAREYSTSDVNNMYEYASEVMGVTLSDNMQENIDNLKAIQNYIGEHFIRDKEPILDIVKDNDSRSLADILKDDMSDADFMSAIFEDDPEDGIDIESSEELGTIGVPEDFEELEDPEEVETDGPEV